MRSPTRWPRVKVLAVSAAVVFTALIIIYLWAVLETSQTRFPDARLEAAVRDALDGSGRTFSPPELERITELDAEARGITSLEGIEKLANLAVLNLRGNRVEDVSPLAALSRLQRVSLRDNDIADLEAVNLIALAGLPELRSLDLRHNRGPSHPESPDDHNRISDISVLAAFESLEALDIADNHISDITPLAGLTRLRHLDLRYNPLDIDDLAALAALTQLEYLNLREAGVRGLSGIQELRNLGYLNLHSNSAVASIEPMAGLPRLHTLILRGIPVGPEVTVLETLPALVHLNLRDAEVTDLAPLARLMDRGALQDDPGSGVFAEIDIRENPVHRRGDPDGYQVLEPYWENISVRSPQVLPPPLSAGAQ
ncbi:MAG: leucine-rich repeat domain-containing protein [Spirochaetaceae bacterium]|nr:MAG: leucine-rich repeat domain-containing protein [Spirochaetaceae bacterium]